MGAYVIRISANPAKKNEQLLDHHTSNFSRRLKIFQQKEHLDLLCCNLRGIERETLRTIVDGTLSQTEHPASLGSALTHPWITTDYSEALLEFITDPSPKVKNVLDQLTNIHQFVARNLPKDEFLWSNSIPGKLATDDEIPIAQYGSSNIGQMKTIYRRGLGLRYGRKMQAIAGLHFNFSVPGAVWSLMRSEEKSLLTLQDYKTHGYFGLIRNFRRWFWLLLYTMGASPIVSRCFVDGRPHNLEPFPDDPEHLYLPYATSLRMGDLGYQSSAQDNLYVCYNDIQSYVESLRTALQTPYQDYENLGRFDERGERQQLSSAVLQIENEFYSTVRPKQTARSGETQLKALLERGVEYVEVRCVDINPYSAIGIDETQINFLETFLLTCLFEDSHDTSESEYARVLNNQRAVVNFGREPGLKLAGEQGDRSLTDWAQEILQKMGEVAEIMDGLVEDQRYSKSVDSMSEMVVNPDLTPSARLISDIQSSGTGYLEWTINQSQKFHRQLVSAHLDRDTERELIDQTDASNETQAAIEAKKELPLEDFLSDYFNQYRTLGR